MSYWAWQYNFDLWTVTCIGVGFEHNLLLITVYMLRNIYFDRNFDPNYTDEPNAIFITSTLLIRIFKWSKYEYLPHQNTMNILWSSYIYYFMYMRTQMCFLRHYKLHYFIHSFSNFSMSKIFNCLSIRGLIKICLSKNIMLIHLLSFHWM